ncbi:MAG: flippase-like protein [Segetibacter sp.]|nr:flippase-like protein [Segetibacter sp.]
MAASNLKNVAKLILKLAVTGICLWYVSRKVDWTLTWELLVKSNKGWLLFAAILFTVSKIVSSFRLNIYLKNIAVQLSEKVNLQLYWLGMFYNLFLPGGIGGDAYKVILLNRRGEHSIKKLTAAVLLDRISGVAGLGFLGVIYYFLIFRNESYGGLSLAAIPAGLIAYYLLVKRFFPSFIKSYGSTLLLGIVVQLLQVLCVYSLMASIGISTNQNHFIFLFLVSSVVAIIPFTIGGLGAREIVFLWGSNSFMLDKHESVYISILFYLITLLVSFVGIRWAYKNPLKASLKKAD